jgi:hypothetical protein
MPPVSRREVSASGCFAGKDREKQRGLHTRLLFSDAPVRLRFWNVFISSPRIFIQHIKRDVFRIMTPSAVFWF